MNILKRLACSLVFAAAACRPGSTAQGVPTTPPQPTNWGDSYAKCDNAGALRQSGHLDLGVRIDSADPRLKAQLDRAMRFWSGVLDMGWHADQSDACNLVLIDGHPELFDGPPGSNTEGGPLFAGSEIPALPGFMGRMAVDDRRTDYLSDDDLYVVLVHEIGHLLGLQHNANEKSVMRTEDKNVHDTLVLDTADLTSLAARHKLAKGVGTTDPVYVAPAVTRYTWSILAYQKF